MSTKENARDGDKERRKIRCVKTMKDIMTTYYIDAKAAEENGRKVAWITSGGPVEPLIAMDVIPVYPENHGAMIGATKMGDDLCERAEDMGYSRDLCSYARSDIACATINGGPIGGLPRPDMLVCCNNICGTVLKWYEVQARYFNVPLFILDTPITHTDYSKAQHRYVADQFNNYMAFLETHCGKPFDFDRLEEVGRLSVKGQKLWQAVLDTTINRPAPISAFDAFFHLALIVTLRGTRTAVDYYQALLDEMNERVSLGISAVPREEIRLMWDNLPVWYRTKWLSDTFAGHNACLVADTYTSAWCSSLRFLDENDFFNSMVEGYSRIYLNTGVDAMAEEVLSMVERYKADGLVMHSNRSCKPYSLGQYDIQRIVRERAGVPVLVMEADMCDSRNFSESQIQTRIDAFMELVRANL
ncbi:MAG: 2-hydroxyglutaryl-CoA dehydratase [Desulfobacteraceae bacterium]|nr:2-hydroxyglutaryl-CoA dehydratase [Desulfobacteraceae bacterium]